MGLISDLVQVGVLSRQAPFMGQDAGSRIDLAGTNQATGTAITRSIIIIDNGTGGSAFCAVLPQPKAISQDTIYLRNDSGVSADIYPAVGNYINSQAINTAITIPDATTAICVKFSETTWLVMGSSI